MYNRRLISRRELLQCASMGFGSLAVSALLSGSSSATAANEVRDASQPLSPRPGHFRPRAKSIIFLFMEGGVSQVDSFDYKPLLNKRSGEDPHRVIGNLGKTQFDNVGLVMDSPWRFRQHGECGLWASDLFPHIAGAADDLCIIRSMTSKFPEHTSANYFLHSGFGIQGRPSLGSWMTYGLGSENENLPGYVVVNGGLIPYGGPETFANGFLPAAYQASLLNARGMPLANIIPQEAIPRAQETKLKLVKRLNQLALDEARPVDAWESAIANYELAAGMQVAVPELADLNEETAATQQLYGLDAKFEHTATYGRACLIARRLVERGVRFVEVTLPLVRGYERWDGHNDIIANHAPNARAVDQPIAALIKDLKQRRLLDETLVVWTGEFGRTPFAQGAKGRDHNESGFTLWMAGGGIKGGIVYGSTDEWGYRVIDKPLEIHDLHATILHLMGIDHKRLFYHFGGRDMRLTDVYGHVIDDVLS